MNDSGSMAALFRARRQKIELAAKATRLNSVPPSNSHCGESRFSVIARSDGLER
ncbi:hypothetical protein D3C85_1844150 [compost metagenome]